VSDGIAVLKLKVTSSSVDLEPVAEMCRKARNMAVIDWLLRQKGMPPSERQSKRHIKRKDKAADAPTSESNKIYHAIRDAVPALSADVASSLSQAVNSYLGGKMDWREGKSEDGKRPRRRDAIAEFRMRAPFATALEIPLANKNVTLAFTDTMTVRVRRVLTGEPDIELVLSTRNMPAGIKLLIRDVIDGRKKLADSKLILRQESWYVHLPISCPAVPLDPERVATLSPIQGDGRYDRPFRLKLPNQNREIGDGWYLKSQAERFVGLRKQIGWRYRQRQGAGHGRKKADAAVRKRIKQFADIVSEVRRRMIRDIVSWCERRQCGLLVYHEPTLPLRTKCWFAANGVDWDWTRFVGDLENSCKRNGIRLDKRQLKLKDVA